MYRKRNRIKESNRVTASNLTSNQLRALVALDSHGKAAVSDGHAFTNSMIIRFNIFTKLIDLGLVIINKGYLILTNIGYSIAKNMRGRHILGYD